MTDPHPDQSLAVHVDSPAWVAEVVAWESRYPTDEARMRLAMDLVGRCAR